ncbi:MAPEG family protein [Phenylobacterium sp.]|uniref:MAPEG family protein n=1 Tax=Phenylobacterium sp. TaxID=1871053 RepID=UPI0039190318
MDTAAVAPILGPVVALVLWSMVMWAWLYATRIPAMQKARISLDPTLTAADLAARLPPNVRWKADNYNHLMEQPTVFYATALALALAGAGADPLNVGLAWGYVGLRVVHSLIQATVNVIMLRFAVFSVASLVLVALAVRAAMVVF